MMASRDQYRWLWCRPSYGDHRSSWHMSHRYPIDKTSWDWVWSQCYPWCIEEHRGTSVESSSNQHSSWRTLVCRQDLQDCIGRWGTFSYFPFLPHLNWDCVRRCSCYGGIPWPWWSHSQKTPYFEVFQDFPDVLRRTEICQVGFS